MGGGLLGNKRPDRGKIISGGPEIFGGGTFWGNAKKGWKNFLAVPKSGGNFFGGHNNILGGEFFGKNLKKKNPRGDSLENFPKIFRGDFLGGSYTGGRVWGECWEIKDKIGEKNSGGQKFGGGELLGKMQKKGGKTFWGECWGNCEPQTNLRGKFFGKMSKKKMRCGRNGA